MSVKTQEIKDITFEDFQSAVLNDYRIACESRETSLMGRREVLSGKGSFGFLETEKSWHKSLWLVASKKVIFALATTVIKLL